jgi:dihydrofolate synthase/folylpolyglutamate synthase
MPALDALAYLYGLEQFGIKFGLDNISALISRLGHPERRFQSIHVAGTNGKGSVTAMVAAALRAAGRRSARYTSPHLVDLTERFVIDGVPVTTEALIAAVDHVRRAAEALRADGGLDVQPTFFEVTTAVAFELFQRAGVEVAVLEVGLGGRLDATNVVSPIATAITSIALDHERHLGSTLREIAFEKAGIIKPGVPVVAGVLDAEADAVIARVADERGAELIRATPDDAAPFAIGLKGAHQIGNAAVAVKLLRIVGVPDHAIAIGLANPSWPGRLDLRRLPDGREILLDAAHNPAGAAALASYLKTAMPGKPPLVFAAMKDKDARRMFAALLPAVGALIVTRAENARSADPAALVELARATAPDLNIGAAASIDDALREAWQLSTRIVVAGSIFLLGDVLKRTG